MNDFIITIPGIAAGLLSSHSPPESRAVKFFKKSPLERGRGVSGTVQSNNTPPAPSQEGNENLTALPPERGQRGVFRQCGKDTPLPLSRGDFLKNLTALRH